MEWKHPPLIKIYEALGAIGDERIEIAGDSAKVFSSSGNKFYTVEYDPMTHSIMANDNGSFYQGYLGYPMIAYLMLIGEIRYSPTIAKKLSGIAWKDINARFKNDFEKTLDLILSERSEADRRLIEHEIQSIDSALRKKKYMMLGSKVTPPEGY
jgi:hypothetical protein